MKLSSGEEYGLRCLLRVGRAGAAGSITISELSRAEGISEPNVAKMMRVLREGGFVTSTRGQSGGYALSRTPEQINVGEIVFVTIIRSIGDCSIRSVWRMLQNAVDQVLARITLKDLLVSEQEMNAFPSGASLPAYSKHVETESRP